jgi:asparagine synthase (glutamine-hydrolysing)
MCRPFCCRSSVELALGEGVPGTGNGDNYKATAHARSLYEQARSPRHVMFMEWNNKVAAMHGLEMAFPFLDRDLLCFLMAIPGEMQNMEGVPKHLLRQGLRGVLPDAVADRSWKADLSDVVNQAMAGDVIKILEYLMSDTLVVKHGYADKETMARELPLAVEGIKGPDCEVAWDVSSLLGLELWLEVFFKEGVKSEPGPVSVRPCHGAK